MVRKIKKIPLPLILSLAIVFVLILSFAQNVLLIVFLFFLCLGFMFKFGAALALDVDPVPFAALLLLYLYDPLTALYFMLFALPIVDIVSGRFSHYSFVNFFSLIITILLGFIFPQNLAITLGVIVFNLIRSILNLIVGFGPQTAVFNIVHAIIYFILGSVLSFFI